MLSGINTELKHRGRTITAADVEFIQRLIAEHPGMSRRALSAKLCEAWNWRQPNGALCDMICRGLMLALHRAGQIELPPVRWVNPNLLARWHAERSRPAPMLVDESPLSSTLADILPREFEQVRRTREAKVFNSLLERYHYFG